MRIFDKTTKNYYLHEKLLNICIDNEQNFSFKGRSGVLVTDGSYRLLLFDFFWFHELLLTLLLAIVMIFEIEMLIHTQYVVTAEGNLQIETGRFVRKATIPLEKIMLIQHVKSWE